MGHSKTESTFGGRLYTAIEKEGLSNRDVASEVNVSEKTIGRYLNRDDPPSLDKKKTERAVEDLAKLLGVRREWLLEGKGAMASEPAEEPESPRASRLHDGPQSSGPPSSSPSESLCRVPEVETSAGPEQKPRLEEVGPGFFASEGYIRRKYGVPPEKLCVMRVVGNNMSDTLKPGQQVIAARWDGEAPRDGVIYCLHGPTGFMFRRLRFGRKDGTDVIWIWSDNEESENWWTKAEEFEENYTPLAWMLEAGQKL